MNESSVAPRSKQSLLSKLISACRAVESVEKKGKNEDYDYIRASDVTRLSRKEFFKRGLLIVPDEKEITEKLMRNHAGLLFHYLKLKVEYTVYDTRTGESFGPKAAFGSGLDAGDKALYKAKTGALKYFILDIALLAEPGSDAEADAHPEEVQETAQQKTRLQEYQRRAWASATTKDFGRTPQQCTAYLLERFKISDVTLLSRTEFDEAIRWATGKSDTKQTLELSVHSIESAKKNGKAELT